MLSWRRFWLFWLCNGEVQRRDPAADGQAAERKNNNLQPLCAVAHPRISGNSLIGELHGPDAGCPADRLPFDLHRPWHHRHRQVQEK